MALAPELQKLTKNQKLKLADELWQAAVDDSKGMSAEYRRVIDSRWRAYRAGKVKRISLEELEARVARR